MESKSEQDRKIEKVLALFDVEDIKHIKVQIVIDYLKRNQNDIKVKKKGVKNG